MTHTLASRAAVYTAANLFNSALPFLLLPLLTRVLSPSEYGLVAVFSTSITVLGALTGLSVHGAVNVRHHESGLDMPSYVGSALAVVAGSTAVVLVLIVLTGGATDRWTGISTGWLLAAALASAAQFVLQLRLVVWQARGMAVRFGALQVLQTSLNLGLSLLLVLAVGLGWEGRAAGIAGATAAAGGVALFSLLRSGDAVLRPRVGYVRDALRFGVPLVPHVIGSVAIANSDRLIVAGLAGLHEAGLYAAGMQLGLLVAMLADAVVKSVSPWIFASLGSDDLAVRQRIVRFSYAYFAGIATVAALTALAAPWLLTVLGKEFRSSGEVVGFVALGGAFSGMYLMVVSYVFYSRRNEWLSLLSISVGCFNVALCWFLVQRHGAVGAAQAYALSQLLMFAGTWYAAARLCPMPWGSGLRHLLPRPSAG